MSNLFLLALRLLRASENDYQQKKFLERSAKEGRLNFLRLRNFSVITIMSSCAVGNHEKKLKKCFLWFVLDSEKNLFKNTLKFLSRHTGVE